MAIPRVYKGPNRQRVGAVSGIFATDASEADFVPLAGPGRSDTPKALDSQAQGRAAHLDARIEKPKGAAVGRPRPVGDPI